MITRRNFILGFLALIAAPHFQKFSPFILSDQSIEMRDGWIMMKDDK